jgi:hypothetical protein
VYALKRKQNKLILYSMDRNAGKYKTLRHIGSIPFIWMPLVPIIIADVFAEIYHRIAFPLYGIPYVKRSQYIRILDRAKLPYLTTLEKMFCVYCGYMNGWLHYASVIAGRTESYWCAIMHLQARGYIPSEHEKSFVKYGMDGPLKRRYAIHERDFGSEK